MPVPIVLLVIGGLILLIVGMGGGFEATFNILNSFEKIGSFLGKVPMAVWIVLIAVIVIKLLKGKR